MRFAKAKRELTRHRREITLATKQQIDAWLSDGYPYGVDSGATEVWSLTASEATRYGIAPSVAVTVAEAYREGSYIFGKPCVPERFVDANLRRLTTLQLVAAIKKTLRTNTQDAGREQRLRSLIETYARRAASRYGWEPEDAASKAGRYVTEVLSPHSRSFQDRLRQTPSNSPSSGP